MSMSCLRIRSSSRSSGPSYKSPTATANGKSLASFFAASFSALATAAGSRSALSVFTSSLMRFALLPRFDLRSFVVERHSHRRPYVSHRRVGHFPGCRGTRLKNIPGQPRILLVFLPPLLHRVQDFHKCVRRPALALDASDSRRSAAFIHLSH